jgi:hypothetical protein
MGKVLSGYQQFINGNPKTAKKFLSMDLSKKKKPFEDVSFNRKKRRKNK